MLCYLPSQLARSRLSHLKTHHQHSRLLLACVVAIMPFSLTGQAAFHLRSSFPRYATGDGAFSETAPLLVKSPSQTSTHHLAPSISSSLLSRPLPSQQYPQIPAHTHTRTHTLPAYVLQNYLRRPPEHTSLLRCTSHLPHISTPAPACLLCSTSTTAFHPPISIAIPEPHHLEPTATSGTPLSNISSAQKL